MRGSLSRIAACLILTLAPAAMAQTPDATLDVRDRELLGSPLGPPLGGEALAEATLEVASLMRCPACQGLSVADSHTPAAAAMRAKAEALLAAGYTVDQTLTYFESSYGEFIRLAPRPTGFNLVVWILPVLGLLIGVGLIVLRLRKGEPRSVEMDARDEDDELDAYRERVRREVRS